MNGEQPIPEILRVNPNYLSRPVSLAERVFNKAVMAFMAGYEYEEGGGVEIALPEWMGADPDDTIEVEYDHYQTPEYHIDDNRTALFEQFYMLDTTEGRGEWQAKPGSFALSITEDGENDEQYIFVFDMTNPDLPVCGKIYHGYTISEETELKQGLHLAALEVFLDDLALIIMGRALPEFTKYPEPTGNAVLESAESTTED